MLAVVASGPGDASPGSGRVRRAGWWHLATALAALVGVGLQLWIEVDPAPDPDRPALSTPMRLWNVLSYFTVRSNLLVLVTAGLLWRDPRRAGPVFTVVRLAALTMITVTGLVYAVVLAPLWEPTGWQKVADQTLHYTVPALAVVAYLVAGPRPRFSGRTLVLSLAVPVAYIAYTLVRSPFVTVERDGVTRHWYPYHFIDVDDLGYGRAILNTVGVLLLVLAVGSLLRYLDRRLRPAPGGSVTLAATGVASGDRP